jgi:hypothetical protein
MGLECDTGVMTTLCVGQMFKNTYYINLFLPLANPHVRKKIRARILGLQDGPLLILHIDILKPSPLKYFVLWFQGEEKSVIYFAREIENQKARKVRIVKGKCPLFCKRNRKPKSLKCQNSKRSLLYSNIVISNRRLYCLNSHSSSFVAKPCSFFKFVSFFLRVWSLLTPESWD